MHSGDSSTACVATLSARPPAHSLASWLVRSLAVHRRNRTPTSDSRLNGAAVPSAIGGQTAVAVAVAAAAAAVTKSNLIYICFCASISQRRIADLGKVIKGIASLQRTS